MMTKMKIINAKDEAILFFIEKRREVFFKELNDANLMAKSTLCKHLKCLAGEKFVEVKISKTRSIGNRRTVYALTAKGKKFCAPIIKPRDLRNW